MKKEEKAIIATYIAETLPPKLGMVFALMQKKGIVTSKDLGLPLNHAGWLLMRLKKTGLIVKLDSERPFIYGLAYPWRHLNATRPKDMSVASFTRYVRNFRRGPKVFGNWWTSEWLQFRNGTTKKAPVMADLIFPQLKAHDFGFWLEAFGRDTEWLERS